MNKKNYKGRCVKQKSAKSKEVCRTYNPISRVYLKLLEEDNDIVEIRCNVLLEGLEEGGYTTDFVCVKKSGELMVRECVFRKHLIKPMTVKLLDISRNFWLSRGVMDFGLVIEKES